MEVALADQDALEKPAAALKDRGVSDDLARLRRSLPASQGSRTLADAIRALDAVQVEPEDIILRRPTLDDVFLALTGRAAEDQTEEDAA